jgi:hypothetical protein
MHSNNKMPVLLMTPCKLIGWLPAQAVERALSRFSNGFEVSIAVNSYALLSAIAIFFGTEKLRRTFKRQEGQKIESVDAGFNARPEIVAKTKRL